MTLKLRFQDSLGSKPFPYVNRVLKACGQRKPPICDQAILDYLGLKVRETLPKGVPANPPLDAPELHQALLTCPSSLNREKKEIWLYPYADPRQKRNNQDHEVTHFICPTHSDINIFECDENDTTHPGYKRQEQEAFQGSSAFQMPVDLYVSDILSLPTQIKAIEELHDRYESAFEVAAIWYAYVNPRLCAVVMVEPNTETPDGTAGNSGDRVYQ